MKMRVEEQYKTYWLPVPGKSVTIKRNQEIVEDSAVGIALKKYYPEDVIVEENNMLVQSDPSTIIGAKGITNIIALTQSEYDAITSPDETTLYIITE